MEEIPPVQYACETVAAVNKELQQLTALHAAEPRRNINPFSMRLQGVIDACVMGGIAKYQEAFFTSEFLAGQPSHLEHVLHLRQCIVEQMKILETALALHGKLAPPEVQPLHKRLEECLAQMKQRLKDWGFPSPDAGLRYASTSTPHPPQHRRAGSDAGIEYSPQKVLNPSMAALPDRRPAPAQRAITVTGSCGTSSNRSSSSSSSLYGQLTSIDDGGVEGSDEEGLYCKPSEIMEKLQAVSGLNGGSGGRTIPTPTVPASSRTPRSSISSSAKSPRSANDYIFFTPTALRDSGFGTDRESLVMSNSVSPRPSKSLQRGRQISTVSSNSLSRDTTPPRHDAPPLPPRSSTKSSLDETDFTPPPIQPKRIPKKGSSVSSLIASIEDSVSPRQHRPPPAPPLPHKTSTATPPCNNPPPVPPHRTVINNSTSFSNPLDLGTGSGSLMDEVCSLLAASGCQVMSNGGSNNCPSPPPHPPPPPPADDPPTRPPVLFARDLIN